MKMIFPGMDPYLEARAEWQGFHNSLIIYIRDQLQPKLLPRYVAKVEERVYVELPSREIVVPDVLVQRIERTRNARQTAVLDADEAVEIVVQWPRTRETYIDILDLQSGRRIVATIEVVSPSNKRPGVGRDAYVAKQEATMRSRTHLVEIDLLRKGPHVVRVPKDMLRDLRPYHYLTCVNRAGPARNHFSVYATKLPMRLPRICVPLEKGDDDVLLDIQAAVTRAYEEGCYRAVLDYAKLCRPPLSAKEQAWANNLIQAAGPV